MGFIFNFANFKKGKKKVNPFDLIDDFDYDYDESIKVYKTKINAIIIDSYII
mgnify:CR=1 FL=1